MPRCSVSSEGNAIMVDVIPAVHSTRFFLLSCKYQSRNRSDAGVPIFDDLGLV